MVAMHTEATTATLSDLFTYADIDDVSLEPDECVSLDFTVRVTRETHNVEGYDLDDALEQARLIVARELTLHDLRKEGLSDEDIDRLAAERLADITAPVIDRLSDKEIEAAWNDGYDTAIRDAESVAQYRGSSVGAPALAAAAEPMLVSSDRETRDAEVLARHPLMSVIYAPLAIVQHDK